MHRLRVNTQIPTEVRNARTKERRFKGKKLRDRRKTDSSPLHWPGTRFRPPSSVSRFPSCFSTFESKPYTVLGAFSFPLFFVRWMLTCLLGRASFLRLLNSARAFLASVLQMEYQFTRETSFTFFLWAGTSLLSLKIGAHSCDLPEIFPLVRWTSAFDTNLTGIADIFARYHLFPWISL